MLRRTASGALLALTGCNLIFGITEATFEPAGGGGEGASTGGAVDGAGGVGGSPTTGGGGDGGLGGDGGVGGDGGTGGEGLSGPITGKKLTYYEFAPDGSFQLAEEDLTSANGHVVEAFVEDGGGWVRYPGEGTANGIFTIEGVPPGRYWLHVDDERHFLENRSNVDLSVYTTTRQGTVTIPFGTVEAHLSVTNMTPWRDGDVFQIASPTTSAYVFIADPASLSPPIATGAVSIDSVAPWEDIAFPPQEILTSDRAFAFHLGTVGATPYTTIVDYQPDLSFEVLEDPGTYDLPIAFEQVPHDETIQLHIDVAAFEALHPIANPAARATQTFMAYDVHPAPLDVAGQLIGTPDLLLGSFPPGTLDSNVIYGYGNPFPPDWDSFIVIGTEIEVDFALPGLAPATRTFTVASCFRPPDDAVFDDPTVAIAPEMEPVRDVDVDGTNFFAAGVTASLTPEISWTPPVTDDPIDHYQLRIIPTDDNGFGGTRVRNGLAMFIDASGDLTSMSIPPGVLEPAKHYVFVLNAFTCATCDYEREPNLLPMPNCRSSAVSGIFDTPP